MLLCFQYYQNTYSITYPTVHLYCNKPEELASKIPTGNGAVNVQTLEPDSIQRDSTLKDKLTTAEPIQAVVDIFYL